MYQLTKKTSASGPPVSLHDPLRLASVTAALVMVSLLDLWTPLGITVWVLDLLLIWYAASFPLGAAWLPHLSGGATVAMAAGLILSPPGVPLSVAGTNRFIGIIAIWSLTIVLRQLAKKQAELSDSQQALHRSREQLAVTLRSIGDAVIATDTGGQVTFLNNVAARLLGRSREDVLGRPLSEVFAIVHQASRRPVADPVTRALEEGTVVGLADHTVLVRPDGMDIAIDDSAAPIREADGTLIGVVLIFRDVSERQQAERTQSMLSAIVTSTDDAIISQDRSGLVTSWNKAAERIFGYTAREAMGRPLGQFLQDDRERRGKEGIGHYETVRRKKDGTMCEIAMTVSPIVNEEDDVIGESMIGRDVTQRKRAERALYDSQERLRVALESIADAVLITDGEGRITFLNGVAAQLLRCESSEVLGCPVQDVFRILHEETRRPVENPVDQVLQGAKMSRPDPTVLVRGDGTEIPIADSAAPVCNAEGHLMGVVLVFRDITARRDSERRARQWTADLERRVAERTEALVRSQDSLRALASQLSLAEHRERKRLATDLHDYLAQLLVVGKIQLGQAKQRLREQAPTLEPLVQDTDNLLDKCLTYTRTLMAQLSPSILTDLGLAPALLWLGEQMEQHHLTVNVEVPDVPFQLPEAQATVLFQCARELLMNVVKHAHVNQARLSLTRSLDGDVALVIEDRGIGFDATRPAADRSRDHFGLFSIQERMESTGGWCLIRSSPGCGTRVELGLTPLPIEKPLVAPEPAAPVPLRNERTAHHKSGSARRILLVDDHAMVRQGLRSILDMYGDLEVVGEASDGEEAVSLADVHRPDLVVMDINLPKLNGIEATRRITQAWPDTIVIGLSVHYSLHTQEALRGAGAAALLSKEQATDALYRTITEVWLSRHAGRP